MIGRLTGKTGAQNRVYSSRSIPLPEELLPAVLVYVNRAPAKGKGPGGEPKFNTRLELTIEAVIKDTIDATVDDKLDILGEQIEAALLNDLNFVSQFETIDDKDSDTFYSVEGDRRMAHLQIRMTLQFTETYHPVVTDDFKTVHIKTDAIDPADPNLHPPDAQFPDGYGGQPGPDKRVEVESEVVLETD